MNQDDLFDWLEKEGVADEVATLTRLTVRAEIDNLELSEGSDELEAEFDWNRLMLAGSILARSNVRRHKEFALRIATAAVTLDTSVVIKDAGAVLLEKLSNHRSAKLAEDRSLVSANRDERLGVSMRLESSRRLLEDSVLVGSDGTWLNVNEFQGEFWEGASSKGSWLSASAPTASGKTFLILQWLVDQLLSGEAKVAIYLAPTRALVTEIETSLKELVGKWDNIEVSSLPLTDYFFSAITQEKAIIYVFTQERLHLLANLLEEELVIDLLIVDEAHKIGDNQRGVILQDAIERISRANRKMKAVFVSPATQNPGELLADAPEGISKVEVDSDNPTVLQNIILAEQVPRKPKQWTMQLDWGEDRLPIGTLKLTNSPGTIKKRLAFIAAAAGERGGTLVYCNGAAEAEDVALLISQLSGSEKTEDQELLDLADLARKGVHRSYQLAPLVERGVAFHYGNMPALIRMEIERLFKLGKIRFLACTSTLIEGVNLSCRTIVVRGPRKGKGHPMEPHDFWNLAGRAGRWGNEFQGNIICVEPHNEKAWPSGVPKRSRYPIKRETDAVMADVDGLKNYLATRTAVDMREIADSDQFEQVSSFLINTYVRNGSLLQAALAKRHDQEKLEILDKSLAVIAEELELPEEIMTRHPGVNPIGLQRLLQAFSDYKLDVENLVPAPSESTDAYERYVSVMRRVNQNVFPAFVPDGIVPLHAMIVVEWLKGFSLSYIIRRRIEYQNRRGNTYKLAVLIRETMEMVETVARFKAPKYISAYVDVLKHYLQSVGRDDLIDDDLDIGVALEFGVSSQTLLSLMELGLSRMSSVELYEKIADSELDKNGCIEWIRQHGPGFEGMDIPNLIVREVLEKVPLENQGED
ncbi:DEAD/DEAH box helicase [Pseudaestuariivita rosea]|uniref:DEAD/DEAH box helicase n=1 Tax=Pseudaestuariivita rosea TaxID=2763263 RepID=UPI001ABBAFDF|nr:DEAD/DEAH box helicase [Pseudaestuariivita rosea]